MTQTSSAPMTSGSLAVQSRFDAVRQRLVAQGQLSGELTNGQTVLLAGARAQVGVTTMTLGLADSSARATSKPVVAIVQTGTHQPTDDDMTPLVRGEGLADVMPLPGQSARDPETQAALFQVLPTLRERYGAIWIDGGRFDDASTLNLGRSIDRRWLVVDLRHARRSELSTLSRELERLSMKFDGFLANRFVDRLPGPLAQLTS